VDAAIRAPSGDNTQPWQFIVDAGGDRLALPVDETRDRSPMNAGQRTARIAVGAALENILRGAEWGTWEIIQEPAVPPDVAAIRVIRRGTCVPTDCSIASRVTNRRMYDRGVVPASMLNRLQAETPQLERTTTHWFAERARVDALAVVIGHADALMFGERSMRRAFLSQVRFDAPPDDQVTEGLPLRFGYAPAPSARTGRRSPEVTALPALTSSERPG